MSSHETESARRLRAVVRAAMSGGIWLLIAVQVLNAASQHWLPAPKESSGPPLVWFAAMILAMLAVLYLQGGIYRQLVRTREAVSIGETLRAGHEVFPRFAWLTIKAGLALAGVLFMAGLFFGAVTGAGMADLMRSLSGTIGLLFLLFPFVLVWWLPWVFAREEFRLLPSLQSALKLLWQRLPQLGFLAALLLLPAAALWGLAGIVPAPVMLALNAAALLLVWTANVYCVERLKETPSTAQIP
jgi:hypothetical protein